MTVSQSSGIVAIVHALSIYLYKGNTPSAVNRGWLPFWGEPEPD